DDLTRTNAATEHLHREGAGGAGDARFLLVDCRHARAAKGGDAEALAHRGHRVGRELAPARARTRTGLTFQGVEVLLAQLARRKGADRFEDVLNRDVVVVPPARRDRAAVDHETGNLDT